MRIGDGRLRLGIASGKGGTGKSTVASNMALALARSGGRITLADCDVEEPNLFLFMPGGESRVEDVSVGVPVIDRSRCDYCGKCAEFCRFNAISVFSGTALTFPGLCHSCGGCMLACPRNAIVEAQRKVGVVRVSRPVDGIELLTGVLDEGEHSSVPVIRSVKKMLPDKGISIVDCPPGTSCNMVAAVAGCDYCVLVTEPTPFGLHDLALAVDVLKEVGIPCGVVINKHTGDNLLIEDYCTGHGIGILEKIPYDDSIARAYSSGVMAVDAMPRLAPLFESVYEKAAKEAEQACHCR